LLYLAQRYRLESCIFGINDIPYMLKRPELVQHKMYLNFQPAGCWKELFLKIN